MKVAPMRGSRWSSIENNGQDNFFARFFFACDSFHCASRFIIADNF